MTTRSSVYATNILTSHQVATLLQVNPSTVNNWVREGRLQAFRTVGGHRRIKIPDLLAFLRAYDIPVPEALNESTRRRVLVVDDDDKHLKSLAKALKPYEDRIDAQLVGDSVEALLRIGSHRPHLLILPVQMPKLDGVELCQQLREVPSTREIRVILVASQLDDELDKRARKAGASRLVVRPLDHEVVIREIGIA